MKNSKYGRIFAIATSVLAVLLAITLIVCCAHLYFTGGDQPYSRERVGQYLYWAIVPSVLAIISVISGVVYNVITGEIDAENAPRTNGEILEGYEKRYNVAALDAETVAAIKRDKKSVKNLNIYFHLASALLFAATLIYLGFVADFTVENLNADVIAALAVALPLSAIGILIQVPRIYLVENFSGHQITLIRDSIKAHGAPAVKTKENAAKNTDYTSIARYAILGVSLILIVLGIFNGGVADVLGKAVKICTECIGLG